jgi:hypothetical protein
VIGAMDRKAWQKGPEGGKGAAAATFEQVADFKQVLNLHIEPGGWGPS